MGKVKWGSSADDIDNAEEFQSDFTPYDGPVPPLGNYRLRLKKPEKKIFTSGNDGVELLFEIDEPKSSAKAKYNGCPLWFYLVDVDTGRGNIRNFMTGIGGTGRHWASTVTTKDDRDREIVTKWGNIVAANLVVRAELKRGRNNENEPRAEIKRFLPKADESDPTDSDSGDSDGNEPPF